MLSYFIRVFVLWDSLFYSCQGSEVLLNVMIFLLNEVIGLVQSDEFFFIFNVEKY